MVVVLHVIISLLYNWDLEDYYASGTGILKAVSGNPLLDIPFPVYPHLASFCFCLMI